MVCLPSPSVLILQDQFLLVFIKQHLGLTHKDLAFWFKVSCGTVTCVSSLARCFGEEISMPHPLAIKKRNLKKNLTPLFKTKEFKHAGCLIDCSEVFLERLTSLSTRAVTYSNSKSYNTVKFLVGISPAEHFVPSSGVAVQVRKKSQSTLGWSNYCSKKTLSWQIGTSTSTNIFGWCLQVCLSTGTRIYERKKTANLIRGLKDVWYQDSCWKTHWQS